MKTAKSLIYGGESIDAIDCTYDDFKHFAPLCPNCSSPVHLKAGGDRLSTKGKSYKIPQHWAHFAGKSAEEVAACELRVNGYSDADREKIHRVARGQRERWIRRWFWRIWEANVLSYYDGSCSENSVYDADHWEKHRQRTEPGYSSPGYGLQSSYGFDTFDPVYLGNFNQMLTELRAKTIEDFKLYSLAEYAEYSPWEEKYRGFILQQNGQTLEEFNQLRFLSYMEITSERNVSTAFEASRYLCSRMAYRLIAECFYSIYIGDFWIARESYNDTPSGSPEEAAEEGYEDRVSEISADEIMGKLLEIPWASEFARLEALEAAKATP